MPHCCHIRHDIGRQEHRKTGPDMAAIMTGIHGTLAYWAAAPATARGRAFGPGCTFRKSHLTGFARLSTFAANANHAPTGVEGAVTWDAGLDLLFQIAGGR